MSDIRGDLDELGRRLWPRSETLRSRRTRRGESPGRRRASEPLAALTAAVVLIALLGTAILLGRTQSTRLPTTVPQPGAPVASATAAQLAAGRWSVLPAAPIAPRDQASVVWTGSDLLVWGGVTYGSGNGILRADGAAYNPSTGRWRTLSQAPLSARYGQVSVWDGTEMIVWGGYALSSSTYAGVNDGAAYAPATDSWRMLPAAPMTPTTQLVAVWTGSEVVLLGDGPATSITQLGGPFDGAAYDPSTDRWRSVTPPTPPTGHSLMWVSAVQAGAELLAWSDWEINGPCGSGCTTGTTGTDLFRYDERTSTWSVTTADYPLFGVNQALWTGRVAILRGQTWCGECPEPPQPENTSQYDPATNSWTSLPFDPLAWASPVSTWTGDALFSFNPMNRGAGPALNGGSAVTLSPGDASAYDAASGWVRLPPAPFGCNDNPSPVWTGRQVLLYCPGPATARGATAGGLALTVGTSPAPTTSVLQHVDSAYGQQQCKGYVQQHADAHEQLEAEYDMTAGEVNSWDHKILPGGEPISYPVRGLAPATPLSFCYIRGQFAVPAPMGTTVPDRIEVAIDGGGQAYEFTYGFSSTFPARPAG